MNKIIFASGYNLANTIFHAWHHAGGTAADPLHSALGLTLESLDNAHRLRDFPRSLLGWYVGYNFLIFAKPVPNGIGPNGNVVQTRVVGETTAAQKNYNFGGKVISICFVNNFNWVGFAGEIVDPPSNIQELAAQWLNNQLPSLPLTSNKPHWFFGMTECYGSGLTDGWIQRVLTAPNFEKGPENAENNTEELKRKISVLQQLLLLYQKLQALIHTAKLGWQKKLLSGPLKDCSEMDLLG